MSTSDREQVLRELHSGTGCPGSYPETCNGLCGWTDDLRYAYAAGERAGHAAGRREGIAEERVALLDFLADEDETTPEVNRVTRMLATVIRSGAHLAHRPTSPAAPTNSVATSSTLVAGAKSPADEGEP